MIEIEHTLIMLLLLTGLLNAQPKMSIALRWGVVAGVLLALIVPTITIQLPWDWLAILVIPLMLWQTARRVVNARWPSMRRDYIIWLIFVIGIAGVVSLTALHDLSSSLLFGLLVASMAWRAIEDNDSPSHLSQFGPLALAFLLAEIAPAVEAPGRYSIALLVGSGVGVIIGFLAIQAAQRIPSGKWRDLWCIGQVYLAYIVGLLLGGSGVAAALLSVVVFVAVGVRNGLWTDGRIHPQPLDSTPVFVVTVLLLALFGWQTHVPLTLPLLLEISLGLVVSAMAIWIGRRLNSPTFAGDQKFIKVLAQVGFLLIPAVLLWPRGVLVTPGTLGLAIGVAILATIGAHYALAPLLDLYAWLSRVSVEVEESNPLLKSLMVKDVGLAEGVTVPLGTSVLDVARLLSAHSAGCVIVMDQEARLVGIVTEADLFVKEEKLPQTGRSYPALFKQPISPEQIPELYAQLGKTLTVSDVMTQRVIWVKDTTSLGVVILTMVKHGIKCLPVLDADLAEGGKLLGVITRAGIIRLLSRESQAD